MKQIDLAIQLGYTTEKNGSKEKRKYTYNEIEDIIQNSDIENDRLCKYANSIMMANRCIR